MRLRWLAAAVLVPAGCFAALPARAATLAQAGVTTAAPASRNPRWAVARQGPGLNNLYEVSPTLYRGAQPTREGFAELRRLGVKTVVSLRAFHGEARMATDAGLGYERISFKVWHPEDEDLRRFLQVATDPERQPVFVHCQRGADRTGTAVAVYRVCVQGWSKADAIDEMVNGGYRFETRFIHLPRYVRSLDVAALSTAVFRPPASPAPAAVGERP